MLKKSLPHGGELVILDAVGVPFGVVYMGENNYKEDLALKVKQALASMKSQLKFRGFSEESINFYNDFPADRKERYVWWNSKSDSEYKLFLKPEFEALVEDLTLIISKIDSGIETKLNLNLGLPVIRDGPRAHRWAALHSKGRDKRIDVQFFINLTSKGARVGIYFGKHKIGKESWKSFVRHLHKNKEQIFHELNNLEMQGYVFINTIHDDYINKSDGVIYSPTSSQEMYEHVCNNEEIDIVRVLDITNLSNKFLIEKILECFVQTRLMYELLQLSKFNHYSRALISRQD
tara:strand:+ start:89 stop:958 length:870 start_codon:yes stop_codon:yes gene_type:complete